MEKKLLITKKGKEVKTEIGKGKKTTRSGRSYGRQTEVIISERGQEMLADMKDTSTVFTCYPNNSISRLKWRCLTWNFGT
ncbi:hypothetical protein [Paenibacillus sp. TSA_86.1]|uniref:hypothetical protein n=1 Tax=Paenibacillus sp. TSA_86.1 TaxID=3415649 RepID=UPI00404607E4